MIRRIAVVAMLALALVGTTDALAKKKKPKIPLGVYPGQTAPDGLPVSVTVNPGRKTGSISYCQLVVPITITGKSFVVAYTEPTTQDTVNGSGYFNAKKKTVSGSLAPNGCTSVAQTFLLKH